MVAHPRYVLYGAVLLAGLHDLTVAGDGTVAKVAALVTAVALLLPLEKVEQPAVRLAAQTVLFTVVAVLDGSGFSNLLFLLLPFGIYLAYGRTAAVALSVAAVGGIVGWRTVTDPHWYTGGENVTDLLMMTVGLVLAVAMAAAAVGESETRARLRAALHEVAELSATAERNRLARDIHDSLGHHLTAVSIQLEKASAFRERDADAAERAVLDARQSARHALDEVRQAVRTLASPFSLSDALAQLGRDKGDGMCAVHVEVAGDEGPFPEAARVALFRAAQEGLTNARRHAGAERVTIAVAFGADAATLVVEDDGRGLPAEAVEGFGLRGMRERMALLGGAVEITGREPGNGVTINAMVPRHTA